MDKRYEMKKASTVRSTFGLILVGAMIIALLLLIILVLTNPVILASTIYVILIIIGIVAIAAVILIAVKVIIAIPMYAMKGEEYQEGVDYSLDDVKEVDGTMVDKDRKD